jgi:hypothetical protein
MNVEQLWRAGKVAGLAVVLTGVCLAQSGPEEIDQLKAQVAQLQKQIEVLSKKLDQVAEGKTTTPEPKSYPAQSLTATTTPVAAPVASAAPPAVSSPIPNPPLPKPAAPQKENVTAAPPPSPLQIPIGNVTITPVGFMDLTGSWKDTNAGGSLGTNFGNFPYNNSIPAAKLSEFKFSPQNSRLGFRVDGSWRGWRFIGYNEFDFLGTNAANNVSVTNGAFVPRLRLYWVDTRKGKFEFLAGQSWSMMTPNRKGISALPGDLFYSQVIDVNYIVGLPWDRQPGVRFLYHPSEKVTMGLSLENPDQYIGGSGGGPVITLPSAFSGFANSQLDNASGSVQNIPNVHPDIIAKVAFDPNSRVHFEVAGLERTFKVYDTAGPNAGHYSTVAGGGGSVNGNFEVAKNFRLISNNYYSDGGGRYLFGEAPDVIVRADGSLSPIHSGGFNEGFETTVGKFLLYGYYGATYVRRNTAVDANGSLVGYGFRGAPNSQNKAIQEVTFGYNQTLWKDAKYGAINLMAQYAWFTRDPWYIAPNSPKATHMNTIFFDVRYTLPGSAPTVVPK